MKSENIGQVDIHPDDRKPVWVHRADWASDDRLWKGFVQGEDLGTGVTVLFYSTEKVGEGPRWHVHPYDEIFIIRKGKALFTIGEQVVEAGEGDILVGPAEIPHKYHNIGPGSLETIDIHLSKRWIQTDLQDPALESH